MATLRREGDELVVLLNDLEKIGGLGGGPRVPLSAIRDVRVTDNPFRELRGLRAPGTGIPGVIALGTWRYRGGKDFAALYRGGPAVVVELEGAPLRRLLVPAHDAALLREELLGETAPRGAARDPSCGRGRRAASRSAAGSARRAHFAAP